MTPRQQAILGLAELGHTTKEISEITGCNRDYVSRVRNRANLPSRVGRPVPWSEDDLLTAHELLQDGASYRDVAETTGIPRTTLRSRFPGLGFSEEDTARVREPLSKLPDDLRWSLVRRNRLD